MTAPPVVLRIKVRYEQPEAFVERFAPYVARAGLFLRSKTPRPAGTEVRFELRLADDRPVLVGTGVVRWAREPAPDRPQQPPGMAIEFTRVTRESRDVILKMLELRRKLQLVDGPRGLPNPPDDDVAVTAATTASATAAQVQHETGPVSTWRRPAVAPLEPMAARPRRVPPAEVISSVVTSASAAPLADAFGEIEVEEANLPAVLARARALAGGDIERELAALLEHQAVPVETPSLEDASARLAALLGTAPVSKRNRSADTVPAESKPSFVPPPKVALQITADLVPAAKPPGDETKVVSLEAFAQLTEGATRVVNLDALAATTARDPEERTAVFDAGGIRDDDRTHVISARQVDRAAAGIDDPADDTLDFDRPRPAVLDEVPRDFLAQSREEQDTNVRKPARRTTPPPPPPAALRGRPTPSPFTAVPAHDDEHDDDDDDDDGATVAEPVEPTAVREAHLATGDSSGSIDLTDLVSEIDADAAQAVPLDRSLGGDALDPDGLMADLGAFERRRNPAPEGPYPDLASFADPPVSVPRAARVESLDAALSALEDSTQDDDGHRDGGGRFDDDVRTSYQRPPSGGRSPEIAASGDEPSDDDDVDIDIEFDDDDD